MSHASMTRRELGARAQSLGLSLNDYIDLLHQEPAEEGGRRPVVEAASIFGTRGRLGIPTRALPGGAGADGFSFEDLLSDALGGIGGGGARPQTAEEAANLLAQSKLFAAQAANIPKAQELARRATFAEIGVQQAERAANPRRIFEAIYAQARLKMPELAKSLQERINLPGFKHGGSVRTERGTSRGEDVDGPVLALVGKDDDEYALLAPGSVIAPKKAGDGDDVETAKLRIFEQIAKGKPVSAERKPVSTRLKKAQGGLDLFGLTQDVIDKFKRLRGETTKAVLGATRGAVGGTSLFDPLGGSTFEGGQADFLRRLNLRQFAKQSPTQREALFSTLSANLVEPEDFLESLTRQFAGFNPVKAGTRAMFSGILGR